MSNESAPMVTETITDRRLLFPALSWGAIIGGTVATIAIQILLSTLGTGAGLAIFTPSKDNDAIKDFSEGAAAIWSGCALVSLFFGAVIAGRFSRSVHGGFVHGILVWSVTSIFFLSLLGAGTGWATGGAMKVFGDGLGLGAKTVSSGLGDVIKDGAKRSSDQLSSYVNEAVQAVPTNSSAQASIRAKREIGFAVTKLFAPGNEANTADNRAAAIKTLQDYGQMNEADATKTVDDWIASYKNLQAELDRVKASAAQKAKAAADEAAHDLSKAAIWSFFGMLLGLLVSAGGGVLGADHAWRRAESEAIRVTQFSTK